VQIESAKLVVVGSSQFALDASMRLPSTGLDFLSSSMNWLLDRTWSTGAVPKTITNFSIHLTEDQIGKLALITLAIIPGLAAFLGFVVWIRRRA